MHARWWSIGLVLALVVGGASCILGPKQDDPAASPGSDEDSGSTDATAGDTRSSSDTGTYNPDVAFDAVADTKTDGPPTDARADTVTGDAPLDGDETSTDAAEGDAGGAD